MAPIARKERLGVGEEGKVGSWRGMKGWELVKEERLGVGEEGKVGSW